MGTYLGFGDQGFGEGGFGDTGNESGVILGATILFDPNAPYFLVSVLMRLAAYKPTTSMGMMGPSAPFIRNFWIMNEATGTAVNDLAQGNVGTLPTGWAWSANGHVTGFESLHRTSGSADITIAHAIALTGPYAIETYWAHTGTWVHTVVVNDPVLGKLTYTNGVLTNSAVYDATTKNVTALLALAPATADQMEYMRIWSRALTAPEVAALHTDPYLMFGASEADLLELATIINFMKPAKSSWGFDRVYSPGETP